MCILKLNLNKVDGDDVILVECEDGEHLASRLYNNVWKKFV